MNKRRFRGSTLLLTFFLFGTIAVPAAQAQNFGQVLQSVIRSQVQPAQTQPYPARGVPVQGYAPQQTYPQQPYPPQQTYPQPVNNWNPVVIDTGKQVGAVTYDPFTGQIIVQSQQQKVRDSYFDANRNNADPGSYRYVNRYEPDGQGGQWHVTGYQWDNNGKPHGNLSRRRVSRTGVPGVIHDETENVAYSVQNNARNSNGKTNNNQNQPRFQPQGQPQPIQQQHIQQPQVQPRSSTPVP